jgi:hypothetical protein
MDKVYIYDIYGEEWYTQRVTGDPSTKDGSADARGLPTPRMGGCIATASAPDNSSHNVYMTGGSTEYLDDAIDEVWVLTLPMFRWTRVYQGMELCYPRPAPGHSASGKWAQTNAN